MKVKVCRQFSVFLENRVGALAGVCDLIYRESINVLAICAIDTVEEAVLRMVTADEKRTLEILKAGGFKPLITDVLLIELDNSPGTTGKVATKLAQAGINIDYIYASAHPGFGQSLLILRTHRIEDACRILEGAAQ